MCASDDQDILQSEEMDTLQQYQSMMKTQYADQQGVYSQISKQLEPILAAGPDQTGMSAAEVSDLKSQAVGGTATNYAAASKALNESESAEGGGNVPITSGGQQELKEELASSAAGTESEQETQIEGEDYALGRQNFENAEQGEFAIASGENPLGYGGLVEGQEGTTNSEANAIASEDTSWINAAIGAAGAVGGAAAGNPGGIFGA